MLTRGDDYPIHQTPDPIAFAGSDRNFYDRYFFNGYSLDGEMFFGAALGVYPNLNIMDAAFAVRIGDVQYNLHASRHLNMERMDIQVGPIRIEVIEPLRRLRIVVNDNEHGIAADLLFEGRHDVIEEPRSVRRNGPRVLMDYTRLTQLGDYTGWVRAGGHEVRSEQGRIAGTRDRSWGMRVVGLRDPQAMVPVQEPQFHWYWVPAHLEDRIVHFFINHDGDGMTWHGDMVMVRDGGVPEHFTGARIDVVPHPGSRWPARGVITFADRGGGTYRIELMAERRLYLSGLGYLNPEWSHGLNKGPLAIGYDEIHPGDMAVYAMNNVHAEAFARLILTEPNGRTVTGVGTFESLSMGRYAPWGVTGLVETP